MLQFRISWKVSSHFNCVGRLFANYISSK